MHGSTVVKRLSRYFKIYQFAMNVGTLRQFYVWFFWSNRPLISSLGTSANGVANSELNFSGFPFFVCEYHFEMQNGVKVVCRM